MASDTGRRTGTSFLSRAGGDLLVNAASLFVFAGLAITGLFFMEGGGGAKGLHELLGYLMVGLVAVHVIRHSRWIATVAAGKLLGDAAGQRRTWAALAVTTALLFGITAAGLLAKGGEGHGREGHEHRRSVELER